MNALNWQALSSLFEATKSRLSDDSRLAARGLGPTAKTLREHMNSIVVFGQEAMVGDSEQLQNASRDLSFSLAHVFIGGWVLVLIIFYYVIKFMRAVPSMLYYMIM